VYLQTGHDQPQILSSFESHMAVYSLYRWNVCFNLSSSFTRCCISL